MKKQILVYGWYGHFNIGDELMAEALRKLLFKHEVKFVNHIKYNDFINCDLLIIGGGSFLSFPLKMDKSVWSKLETKPIFYVGVGAETDVHPDHEQCLRIAAGVFVRSTPSNSFHAIRQNVVKIPDLTHVLGKHRLVERPSRTILFIPNAQVLPTRISPNWERAAWDYFKSETAQALDELILDGWKVTMAPFCDDVNRRDSWACAELIAHCTERRSIQCLDSTWYGDMTFDAVRSQFESCSIVVTQRFHGAILAQITSTPCVVIHHHDKLAQFESDEAQLVPYYGVRKDLLKTAVQTAKTPILSNYEAFDNLKEVLENVLT